MALYTDPAFVERRVKRALAFGETTPDLDQDDIEDLLTIAKVGDSWETARLNAVIAQGWTDKAGLVAGLYDIGGGSGKYLKQSDWWAHCTAMAASYRSGAASIDPDGLISEESSGGIITVFSDFLTGSCTGNEWS